MTTPRKPRPQEAETDRRKTEKENFTVTVDLSKQTGVRHYVDPKLCKKNHDTSLQSHTNTHTDPLTLKNDAMNIS